MIDNETYARRLQEAEDRATMELAIRNTELMELRAAFRELRAERDALRQTVDKFIDYRDRVGALGFQLEKADDYINTMRQLVRSGTQEAKP